MIAATTGGPEVAPITAPDTTWRRMLLLGALVVIALALSFVSAPTPLLLLVALPILVLVPGYLAATLVLGAGGGAADVVEAAVAADESETADETADSVNATLRLALPPLLGLLTLLATVLLVAVIGAPISTESLCLTLGAVTVALLVVVQCFELRAARGRTVAGGTFDSAARPVTDWWAVARRGGLLVAACLVLISAVVGARALQPNTVQRYTQISFNDPAAQAGPLSAAPGAAVTVSWTLAGYAHGLSETAPDVQVLIGDSSAADLVVNQSAPVEQDNGTGSTSEQAGTATFTAPALPGLYRVALTVTSGAEPPAALTEYLQVG